MSVNSTSTGAGIEIPQALLGVRYGITAKPFSHRTSETISLISTSSSTTKNAGLLRRHGDFPLIPLPPHGMGFEMLTSSGRNCVQSFVNLPTS